MDPLFGTIRGWCPVEPPGFDLLYRASRDGLLTSLFHALCDSSICTVTLARVQHQLGEATDSVGGGFSSASWFSPRGLFLFMLKNGSSGGPGRFQPTKWDVKYGQSGSALAPYILTLTLVPALVKAGICL